MSDISLEIQLCRTTTTYESIQTCLDIMKKDYDNEVLEAQWTGGIIIFILLIIAFVLWRKFK